MILLILIILFSIILVSPTNSLSTLDNSNYIEDKPNKHKNIKTPRLYNTNIVENVISYIKTSKFIKQASSTKEKFKIIDSKLISLFIEHEFSTITEEYNSKANKLSAKFKYVIAYSNYKETNYDKAIKLFNLIKEKDILFYDYVLFYKGSSYFCNKDYENSAKLFNHIRNEYPNFRYKSKVINLEAESYYNDNYNTKIFTEFTKNDRKKYKKIDLLICKTYYNLKNYDRTLEYAFKIINTKNHNNTKEILPLILEIFKQKEKSNNTDKFNIAKAYFIIYEYHKAKNILKKLSPFISKELEYDRLNYLASIHWKLKEYNEALTIYEDIIRTYTGYKKEKAEYNYALIQIDTENYNDAIQSLSLIVSNKKHNFKKNSIKQLVKVSQSIKNYSAMFEYMKTLATKYNIIYDCWNYILNLLNENRFDVIADKLPNYIKVISNNHYLSKLYFWLGWTYEQLEEWDKAYKSFQNCILYYNNHYYSSRALLCIKNLYKRHIEKKILLHNPFTPLEIEQGIEERLKEFLSKANIKEILDKQYQQSKTSFDDIRNDKSNKFLAFLEIGDFSNAFGEWKTFYNSIENKGLYSLYFMYLFYNSNIYHMSMRHAEMLIKKINEGSYRNYIPDNLIRYIYPQYYKEEVRLIANENKIDYKLVFSLIREESRFYHLAVSRSGAEGLMQLMPSTGKWLAEKLKREKYKPFNPYENIYLGSKFFADLINQFQSDSIAVGAYNAGGGRMNKWKKKYYNNNIINIEHFVENIPYKETHNHVIKVIGSFSIYNRIY